MIYFTADHHFGHANIIKHCDRPFASVEEMDACLLEGWNATVQPQDTVYILGDFFFRNNHSAEEMLKKLRGKKHLIIGNHDKDWMKKVDLPAYFESVSRMEEISDGAHKITLCHYPMMTWNGVAHGSYMIHGHIHNNRGDGYWQLLRTMPGALNAGVDINGFVPVNFNTRWSITIYGLRRVSAYDHCRLCGNRQDRACQTTPGWVYRLYLHAV